MNHNIKTDIYWLPTSHKCVERDTVFCSNVQIFLAVTQHMWNSCKFQQQLSNFKYHLFFYFVKENIFLLFSIPSCLHGLCFYPYTPTPPLPSSIHLSLSLSLPSPSLGCKCLVRPVSFFLSCREHIHHFHSTELEWHTRKETGLSKWARTFSTWLSIHANILIHSLVEIPADLQFENFFFFF